MHPPPLHPSALALILAAGLLPWPAQGGPANPPPAPQAAPPQAAPPAPGGAGDPGKAAPAPLTTEQLDLLLTRGQQNLRLHGLSLVPTTLPWAIRDFRAAVKGLPPGIDGDREFTARFGLAFALASSELPADPSAREALAEEALNMLYHAARATSSPPGQYASYPGLWIVDGILREQMEEYEAAEKQITEGFALLEDHPIPPSWQLDQLRLMGRLARGRSFLQPPLNSEHLALKDFQEALTLAEKALKDPLAPRENRLRSTVLTHLAAAYQTLDYFEEAEKILADLVRTDPGRATHLYNMALVKATQQKYPEALSWYRKAADLDRTDPNPHIKIAFILLRYPDPGKGPEIPEALREGEIYHRLKGGEPGAEYCALRGEAAFLRNDLKEAETWFRKVLAVDPGCRTALQRMMNILGQKEDPTDAVRKEMEEIRKKLQDSKDANPTGPGMDNRRKRADLTFC